jgi:hypothetical protein
MNLFWKWRGLLRHGAFFTCLPCALVACGGDDDPKPCSVEASDAGAGNVPEGPDPRCVEEVIDPTTVIDDFEDQNGMLVPIDGRSGGWWTTGDDTPNATIFPERNTSTPALPALIPEGRCNSRYAMRVTGQGFDDWGALLGLSFVYSSNGPAAYDASRHRGVRFWARVGDTSTNQLRVAIADANSEPEGGRCTEDGPSETACFDTFGILLPGLDVDWKRFQVPFEGLEQRNFGLPAAGIATDAVFGVHFAFESGAVFDLWIDDLQFY